MFLFSDLVNEVKRRATRDQSGTSFDTPVKNLINLSLLRLAREANWKTLRRTSTFDTVTSYTEGSGACAVTEDSADITVTGATFITDGIQIGRNININGSNTKYKIEAITGETTITLNQVWDSDTATDATYEILPQQEYNLPIQASHRSFLWHREYGSPKVLEYVPSLDFLGSGINDLTTGIPQKYYMWGANCVVQQPIEASVLRVYSSSSADTSIGITIFGIVSGYPDYETITTNVSNGTTAVSGSKSFTSIERIVKDASTTGRITIDSNTAAVTVATLPVGDTTGNIMSW